MPLFKGKKLVFLLILFIVIVGGLILLFNEFGFVKYVKLKTDLDSLNSRIEKIEKENEKLKAEIDSLERKIPAKIEKVAREKYEMKRPGEKVIEVKEK